MEQCKECELALYCYSDSSNWVFRTKQELEEKLAAIANCPCHEQVQEARSAADRDGLDAGTV
jgi:hypothetical protein